MFGVDVALTNLFRRASQYLPSPHKGEECFLGGLRISIKARRTSTVQKAGDALALSATDEKQSNTNQPSTELRQVREAYRSDGVLNCAESRSSCYNLTLQ